MFTAVEKLLATLLLVLLVICVVIPFIPNNFLHVV